MESSRVVAPDHHGEGVVEPERRSYRESERALVAAFHAPVHVLLVAARLLLENRRQRRAGVLGVDVDSSSEDCLVTDEGASKVEAAFDQHVGAGFDNLGEEFSEDELLGEVLGANHNAIATMRATGDGEKKQDD